MKKIIDFIVNIILAIVYPNRILRLFRVKNLDQNSNKILGNDNVVKILAFIGAITFVIFIRYEPAPPREEQRSVSVQLNRNFNENDYAILSGIIPQYIEVILAGRATDIELFATGNIEAYIDLNALGEGRHSNIIIRLAGIPEYIMATARPSTVDDVEIARLEQMEMRVEAFGAPLEIDISSRNRIGELIVYPEYVTVIGPRVFLNEIDTVRTSFDVSEEELTTPGITIPGFLIAHNAFLEDVRGVTFEPPAVTVQIEVYEHVKQITLELNEHILHLPRDYEILDVSQDIERIEVWGDFDEMDEIFELQRIHFSDLDENGQIALRVQLPSNVYTEIDGEVVSYFIVIVTVEYEELPTEPAETEAPITNIEGTSWLDWKERMREIMG